MLIHDYKKWLVFHPGLGKRQEAIDLHKAIGTGSHVGLHQSQSQQHVDGQAAWLISSEGFTDELLVNDEQKVSLLSYIETHYMVHQQEIPQLIVTENQDSYEAGSWNTPAKPSDRDFLLPESITSLFYHYDIIRHVRGYAVIGFILSQIFVAPQFFDQPLPDYTTWIFMAMDVVIGYWAVKNYKDRFLRGGILFRVVRKINMALFGLIFSAIAIEIFISDVVFGRRTASLFASTGIAVIMILGGLFIGWIIALVVYFPVGGKVVTDPTKVQYLGPNGPVSAR